MSIESVRRRMGFQKAGLHPWTEVLGVRLIEPMIRPGGHWAPPAYRPAGKPPMLENRNHSFSPEMGLPIGGIIVRWGLPWLLTAGGIFFTSAAVKSIFPEVPINKENIGLAALLGGAGITSYLVSDLIPESYRAIPYALAIMGVSASLYFLFKPTDTVPPEPMPGILPPAPPKKEQVPTVPPGRLSELLVVRMDPRQEATGGTARSMYFTSNEFAFSIRNQSNQDLSFFAGLGIYDKNLAPVFKSPPEPTVIGRKYFTVPKDSVISAKLVAPPFSFWFPQTVTVRVELFRGRDDSEPFMVSDAIPIKVVYPPGGLVG